MPRESFERELRRLQDEVVLLGSEVETAIQAAVKALKERDDNKARQVIAGDRRINEHRFAIERDTLILIATQQPAARDLRILAAVLEIATELERMGDYAKGIAKVSLMIGREPLIKPLIDLPRMADKACSMLDRALRAFTRGDVELARSIPKEDDEVDALYDQVYRELMMMVMINPSHIKQANKLLWVAHNLERTADRVSNICERVIFTVTGEMVEFDMSGSDELVE